jgi:hypothetical protein
MNVFDNLFKIKFQIIKPNIFKIADNFYAEKILTANTK